MSASAAAPAFTVRPVRPAEHAPLGEIIVAAYAAIPDAPQEPHWYVEKIRDVESRTKVATVLAAVAADGTVLGGVTYVPGPESPLSEELGPDDAGVRMLAVEPAWQGRGVGRALMEACITEARRAGRRRIVLHTGSWMRAAHRLYERLGFRRDAALDFDPLPGMHLYGYVLMLERAAG